MPVKKPQPSTSTALAKWDEELAKYAEASVAIESHSRSGQFFSVKTGILSWQDAPVKDNQMAVIILDFILENVYYEGRYDPNTIRPPTCFAFNRDEKAMAPHKVVFEAGTAQNEQCNGCPKNEFGTAIVGKGKACKNVRRLGMIPAGTISTVGKFEFFKDDEFYETAEVGFLKLPITSVKGYSSFVKQVAGALHRPPFGIVTKVKVVPDASDQFKVLFEPITVLPDHLMGIVFKRHEEVASTIDFPYSLGEDEKSLRASKNVPQSKRNMRKY